jgi:hypothetical protein
MEAKRDRREARQVELVTRGAAECAVGVLAFTPLEGLNFDPKDDAALAVVRCCIVLLSALMRGGTRAAQSAVLKAMQATHQGKCIRVLKGLALLCPAMEVEPLLRVADAAMATATQQAGFSLAFEEMLSFTMALLKRQTGFARQLFRCLQLCCEGHFSAFQEYLRTQSSSTLTSNLVLASSDYLLRLQEHLHELDIIAATTVGSQSQAARRAMYMAMSVAEQVRLQLALVSHPQRTS